ncbi:predicted protein [Streptomyces sviceus ATCC 29083]|uniref:Uncharacterized protein n=1 Tax=Streptomyces sviceus (strain ATCC 29083 / DSM 924 / JCM 4929 / NBRC 13980 / NCIMB 11184 / NRRL 5439 / UC 5370) TaxID=463191 RepID=D6XAW5_STRX2|nr:predicted protein [Streptomyces sviceus ATCC 29083]
MAAQGRSSRSRALAPTVEGLGEADFGRCRESWSQLRTSPEPPYVIDFGRDREYVVDDVHHAGGEPRGLCMTMRGDA